MKFLIVCNHGNVRSVALARAIKDISFSKPRPHPHEAIAVGAAITHGDTFRMLYDWADTIVWMADGMHLEDFLQYVISNETIRVNRIINLVSEIGPDKWFNPMHPELQEIMKKKATELTKEAPE